MNWVNCKGAHLIQQHTDVHVYSSIPFDSAFHVYLDPRCVLGSRCVLWSRSIRVKLRRMDMLFRTSRKLLQYNSSGVFCLRNSLNTDPWRKMWCSMDKCSEETAVLGCVGYLDQICYRNPLPNNITSRCIQSAMLCVSYY